jgi:hypothetical protein
MGLKMRVTVSRNVVQESGSSKTGTVPPLTSGRRMEAGAAVVAMTFQSTSPYSHIRFKLKQAMRTP